MSADTIAECSVGSYLWSGAARGSSAPPLLLDLTAPTGEGKAVVASPPHFVSLDLHQLQSWHMSKETHYSVGLLSKG